MKKLLKTDRVLGIVILTGIVLVMAYLLYLFSFLLIKPDLTGNPSEIPTLNKNILNSVSEKLEERKDADTGGKPDLSKFEYGNTEPF